MSESVTKRLHISGLTPAITSEDLSRRLGSFGTVKALDGYGALDALGGPRKFAYVTLETSQGQLSKCLNILSGTTWKGTKLRIGEAKPHYRERLKREREEAEDNGQARKRQRLPRGIQGVHGLDMAPITPQTVASHPAWRTTLLGRLVRPVRMRPTHPLPPLPSVLKNKPKEKKKELGGNMKGDGKKDGTEKKRKRRRDPPVRARRVTIDPTRWEPEHIKGNLLGGTVVMDAPVRPTKKALRATVIPEPVEDDEDVEMADPSLAAASPTLTKPTHKISSASSIKAHTSLLANPASYTSPIAIPPLPAPMDIEDAPTLPPVSLATENAAHLSLLSALFDDGDGWNDALSLDSDLDADEAARIAQDRANQIEESEEGSSEDSSSEEEDSGEEEAVLPAPPKPVDGSATSATIPPVQATLKDMFAPREEAAFSLLGHLDLDLELDDELDFLGAPGPAAITSTPATATSHAPTTQPSFHPAAAAATPSRGPITIDPSIPFFFPIAMQNLSLTSPITTTATATQPTYTYPPIYPKTKRPKYTHEMALESGKTWRQAFVRNPSESEREVEAKARWERAKGELTGEWKRRHREAMKSRRRRGGGVGDGE